MYGGLNLAVLPIVLSKWIENDFIRMYEVWENWKDIIQACINASQEVEVSKRSGT